MSSETNTPGAQCLIGGNDPFPRDLYWYNSPVLKKETLSLKMHGVYLIGPQCTIKADNKGKKTSRLQASSQAQSAAFRMSEARRLLNSSLSASRHTSPPFPSGLQCLIVCAMAAWFGFPRTLFPLSVNHLRSLSCPLWLSFITAAQNMNRIDFDYCQALQHDPCEKTAFLLSTACDAGTDRLVAPSHSCLSFRHSLASVSSFVSTRRFTWLLISLSHVATD